MDWLIAVLGTHSELNCLLYYRKVKHRKKGANSKRILSISARQSPYGAGFAKLRCFGFGLPGIAEAVQKIECQMIIVAKRRLSKFQGRTRFSKTGSK